MNEIDRFEATVPIGDAIYSTKHGQFVLYADHVKAIQQREREVWEQAAKLCTGATSFSELAETFLAPQPGGERTGDEST